MDYTLKSIVYYVLLFMWLVSILLMPYELVLAADNWYIAIDDEENDIVVYHRRLSSGITEFKSITL